MYPLTCFHVALFTGHTGKEEVDTEEKEPPIGIKTFEEEEKEEEREVGVAGRGFVFSRRPTKASKSRAHSHNFHPLLFVSLSVFSTAQKKRKKEYVPKELITLPQHLSG